MKRSSAGVWRCSEAARTTRCARGSVLEVRRRCTVRCHRRTRPDRPRTRTSRTRARGLRRLSLRWTDLDKIVRRLIHWLIDWFIHSFIFTFVNSVKMNKNIFNKFFSSSGSHTILVFSEKLVWCGYTKVKNFEDMFIQFDRIHERDRRTDRQTDTAWRRRPPLHSIARKNKQVYRRRYARQSLNCIVKHGGWNSYTCNVARSWHWFRQMTAPCNVTCGSGIVIVNSPSGSTLQCDTWLWDDMPLNSTNIERPPYWDSTSGFAFDHITAVILHQSPKFYPNRTTFGRKKWLHVDFQDGGSQPSWIVGIQ